MSRYEFDDDEPYVVIEKHEAGVGPFLVGLAVGAGIALLLAPRSGEETRRDTKRRANAVKDAAQLAKYDRHRVIALDERGKDLRTAQFAKLLDQPTAFAIGPRGLLPAAEGTGWSRAD